MGFFSWVGDKIKKGVKAVCNVAKKVGGAVIDGAKAVGKAAVQAVTHPVDTVKKVANKIVGGLKNITGLKAIEIHKKAQVLFEKNKARYESAKVKFDKSSEEYAIKIQQHLDSINQGKKYIVDTLFPKMKTILGKIKYTNRFNKEYMSINEFKPVTSLNKRDVLRYNIDFSNDFLGSLVDGAVISFKAIVSFGFWANKEAEKVLEEVEKEGHKLDENIHLMDGEIKRLMLMEQALANTNHYINSMIDIYEKILIKANGPATYLKFKCINFTHSVNEEYMKLESLSERDQQLLTSLFNLSVILNKVAKMSLMSDDSSETIKKYNNNLIELDKEFKLKAA